MTNDVMRPGALMVVIASVSRVLVMEKSLGGGLAEPRDSVQ